MLLIFNEFCKNGMRTGYISLPNDILPSGYITSSDVPSHKPAGWWVRDHHKLNKEAGWSKQAIRASRTRGRETPAQERERLQQPADTPKSGRRRSKAVEDYSQNQMKCLMDMLLEKQKKFSEESPHRWAPANQISERYRPTYQQANEYDWYAKNPYPGFRLILKITAAGWKAKLATEKEYRWHEETSSSQASSSKAAQERVRQMHPTMAEKREQAAHTWAGKEEPTMDADVTVTGEFLKPALVEQLAGAREKAAQNPLAVKEENDIVDITAYQVAMHRWELFSAAADSVFVGQQLQEVKNLLTAAGFGEHRDNPGKLEKDINTCRMLKDTLLKDIPDTALDNQQTRRRQDKLLHVFMDIEQLKVKQLKRCHAAQLSAALSEPRQQQPSSSSQAASLPPVKMESSSSDSECDDSGLQYLGAQESMSELQTEMELGVLPEQMHPDTRHRYNMLQVPGKYTDLDFLHNCLPVSFPPGKLSIPELVPVRCDDTDVLPTVFVLTSTNPNAASHFTETYLQLTTKGMKVVPLLGMDSAKMPRRDFPAWNSAFLSWGIRGFPQAMTHIKQSVADADAAVSHREYWLFAEDSVKLLAPDSDIGALLRHEARHAPQGIEIVQLGYRRLTAKRKFNLLDLDTMQILEKDADQRTVKIVGQKLFMATVKGIDLLKRRILCGNVAYFDQCMCELIRAGVAIRASRPLAGSRQHYSMVDGGKLQNEELPKE